MSTGRSLQIVGPETRKLRQPKRDSTHGTTRSPWSADLRHERAVTVCTGIYFEQISSFCTNNGLAHAGKIVSVSEMTYNGTLIIIIIIIHTFLYCRKVVTSVAVENPIKLLLIYSSSSSAAAAALVSCLKYTYELEY